MPIHTHQANHKMAEIIDACASDVESVCRSSSKGCLLTRKWDPLRGSQVAHDLLGGR